MNKSRNGKNCGKIANRRAQKFFSLPVRHGKMVKILLGGVQMEKNAKKRSRAGVILPVAALAAGLLWAGNFTLSLTEMTVSSVSIPAVFDGFRIALVTDLHGRTFGPDNDWLVGQLTNAHPDLIALAGDIADEESNLQDLSRLLPRLAAIAPCYYVTGNHEWRMENRKQWFELLSACGVTRLENSFVMLSREGGSVVLAGVDDPNGPADQKTPGQLLQEIHEAAPQASKIVLCHRNDQLERFARLGADLVLSGHAHGGVVRLPFLGAVFGTHYEFFPDYTAGLYTMGKTTLAVSRGLGGSRRIPIRIANQPEIPVITLRAGETER